MALVTVSTIYQTLFVTMLMLISKGWVIIKPSLHRNDATNVTLLMGGIYLCYSAYYVSINNDRVKFFINVRNLRFISVGCFESIVPVSVYLGDKEYEKANKTFRSGLVYNRQQQQ